MNAKEIDYYERKGKFIVDYLPKEVSDEKRHMLGTWKNLS